MGDHILPTFVPTTSLSASIRMEFRSEQVVVRWMLGFMLAGIVTLIVRLFSMDAV